MTLAMMLLGILCCVFLSGFFSGSEMAFSSCNRLRLENDAEDGSKNASLALYITSHFDDALSAILIGNNLVNVASSTLATSLILLFGLDDYTWAATLAVTLAVIVFGETIPKIRSKKNPNAYALRYARPVRVLMILLFPAVRLVVGLVNMILSPLKGESTEGDSEEKVEELQTIVETAEDEDVLDEEESELVQAAIDFSDISASEAMTARVDVLAIDIEDSREEIVEVISRSHFTRIPVYEGTIDHIIGVLHLNRFLKAMTAGEKVDLRKWLMEPCYVYKTMKLPEVMAAFRRAKQHLAVVVDEYGGTLGIISMEDVLEKVVGDIWDETDTVEDEVLERSQGEYEIDGDMPIGEFLDLMRLREDDFPFESETVGGWTIEYFGSFPEVGDHFLYRDISVTVLAMDDRRVERVLVRREEAN
ncbi:MAG: HlyC/CorC family transporter [Clostridia bacterium]|nr:HlyC/CorC family transporter [Clostridia bacterium]